MKKTKVADFYECGQCGAYHLTTFTGDCRDGHNRFLTAKDGLHMVSASGRAWLLAGRVITIEDQMEQGQGD